jgi:hypothetical protein
LFLDDT